MSRLYVLPILFVLTNGDIADMLLAIVVMKKYKYVGDDETLASIVLFLYHIGDNRNDIPLAHYYSINIPYNTPWGFCFIGCQYIGLTQISSDSLTMCFISKTLTNEDLNSISVEMEVWDFKLAGDIPSKRCQLLFHIDRDLRNDSRHFCIEFAPSLSPLQMEANLSLLC